MKFYPLLRIIFLAAMISSCGDSNDQADADLKDPSVTHPPEATIPDSLQLVNDSVIVPDTRTGTDTLGRRGDSLDQQR